MARRPQQVLPRTPLSPQQIRDARYVGSGEHKAQRWWGGLPGAYVGPDGKATRPKKQQTTICPLVTEENRQQATVWVQAALAAGQVRYYEGDKDFPKRIWYREATTGGLWMGYCVNGALGQYKGWPIEEDERVAVFD